MTSPNLPDTSGQALRWRGRKSSRPSSNTLGGTPKEGEKAQHVRDRFSRTFFSIKGSIKKNRHFFSCKSIQLADHSIKLQGRVIEFAGRSIQLQGRVIEFAGRSIELQGRVI